MNFEAFTSDIVSHGWQVHGTMVMHKGETLHRFGDTQGLHPIYSITKSITSMAAGLAAEAGKLDLQSSVLRYLPQNYVEEMSPEQRAAFEQLTLHRLMTMSVRGFPFRAEGEDWLRFALSCPLPKPEMPVFDYSNIPAYLTGVAITQAMGMDAAQVIEEQIFAPMGIDQYRMGRCPKGYYYGASGMELSVESLCKLGVMLTDGGMYRSQRILPEGYVQAATAVQQRSREGGYGYFFWQYRNGFSMNGKWKQKCYVLPEKELVIAYLCDIQDTSHDLVVSMEKHLLGIE